MLVYVLGVFVGLSSFFIWGAYSEILLCLFLDGCGSLSWVGGGFYWVEWGLLGYWLFLVFGFWVYVLFFIVGLFFCSGSVFWYQCVFYGFLVLLAFWSFCWYVGCLCFFGLLIHMCLNSWLSGMVFLVFGVVGSVFFFVMVVAVGWFAWCVVYGSFLSFVSRG